MKRRAAAACSGRPNEKALSRGQGFCRREPGNLLLRGDDAHRLAVRRAVLRELHAAVDFCEERVVSAHADVFTRVNLRAALADDDAARRDELAAEGLDAEALRLRVAAVTRASARFLVCHLLTP